MNAYDFVHMALLALGEIKGRTKLQKMVYFLGVLTGELEELGFRPHYYGPYSQEVSDALERLRTLGFVGLNVAGGGSVDSRGFEVARYDYKLTPEGKQVAELKTREQKELWQKVKHASGVLQRMGNQDYVKLSIAAKAYFMLDDKKGPADLGDLPAMAKDFGWSVTLDQIKDAVKYLESLQLVKHSTN